MDGELCFGNICSGLMESIHCEMKNLVKLIKKRKKSGVRKSGEFVKSITNENGLIARIARIRSTRRKLSRYSLDLLKMKDKIEKIVRESNEI